MSAAVGFWLGLFFVLPSLRAVLPMLPTGIYFAPIVALGAVLLLRLGAPQSLLPSRLRVVYFALITAWVAWMLAASSQSAEVAQAGDDALLLIALWVVAGLCTLLVDARAVTIMQRVILVGAVGVAILVFAQYLWLGDLSGYSAFIYDFYLTTSTLLALGCACALVRLATEDSRQAAWAFLALFLLAAMGVSLARGSLVFLFGLLLSFVPAMTAARLLAARSVAAGARAGTAFWISQLGLLGMLVGALSIERTRVRILRMFSGNELSEGGRGDLWRRAVEAIDAAPWWGNGLGSSGTLTASDPSSYPHNLFLQAWVDGGLPALLLLAAVIALPLCAALLRWRAARQASYWIPLLLYLLLLSEYAKSESVYTARNLLLLGFALIVACEALRPARRGSAA